MALEILPTPPLGDFSTTFRHLIASRSPARPPGLALGFGLVAVVIYCPQIAWIVGSAQAFRHNVVNFRCRKMLPTTVFALTQVAITLEDRLGQLAPLPAIATLLRRAALGVIPANGQRGMDLAIPMFTVRLDRTHWLTAWPLGFRRHRSTFYLLAHETVGVFTELINSHKANHAACENRKIGR